MCSKILKQKRNFSIQSRLFETKPKRFDVFQNFKNKSGTFPFHLKTLKTKPKRFDVF